MMNKIFNEIKEVLKMSPARFAKIYFQANIYATSSSTIKVDITSTLKYAGYHVVLDHLFSPGEKFVINEREMEKYHATGIAVAALEHYLESKQFEYIISISINSMNEICAEITINV